MNLALPLPTWLAEQQERLGTTTPEEFLREEILRIESELTPTALGILSGLLQSWADSEEGDPPIEIRNLAWGLACSMASYPKTGSKLDESGLFPKFKDLLSSIHSVKSHRAAVAVLHTQRERLRELMQTVIVTRPEWNLTIPSELESEVWTVRISPRAYLRAVANLFWSAIRHPLSETTIDLSTGRVLYRT